MGMGPILSVVFFMTLSFVALLLREPLSSAVLFVTGLWALFRSD